MKYIQTQIYILATLTRILQEGWHAPSGR